MKTPRFEIITFRSNHPILSTIYVIWDNKHSIIAIEESFSNYSQALQEKESLIKQLGNTY